ncbi:MAG: DNA-processing protein DprA, partial [Chitinophagaceae bacterium]
MDVKQEWIYKNILLQVDKIGLQRAKTLIDYIGSAKGVFDLSFKELLSIQNISEITACNIISQSKNFVLFEQQWEKLQQLKIEVLHYQSDEYPKLLKECFDAPLFLYKKGDVSLKQNRFIAIVGTRNPSEYARKIIQQIIQQILPYNPTIVSGMALGIDSFAHQEAINNGLFTFAVWGSGLDVIYPASNFSLSKQIEKKGGLLSEFALGTTPERMNFPQRNRIVAGMCEATLVVETALKGGSMIT